MIDSDLQLRDTIGGVRMTLGGQYRHYAPSSAGTYLDDAKQAIEVNEAGTYVQADTTLFDRLRLAGAGRVDHHSIYGTQLSPKATIQYEVAPSHNVRVGYNRAFKSPTVLEDYLNIGGILPSAGATRQRSARPSRSRLVRAGTTRPSAASR